MSRAHKRPRRHSPVPSTKFGPSYDRSQIYPAKYSNRRHFLFRRGHKRCCQTARMKPVASGPLPSFHTWAPFRCPLLRRPYEAGGQGTGARHKAPQASARLHSADMQGPISFFPPAHREQLTFSARRMTSMSPRLDVVALLCSSQQGSSASFPIFRSCFGGGSCIPDTYLS